MDEHVKVMEDGGLVEEKVLTVPVNEETIEAFCISDCCMCGKDVESQAEVHIWGEPHGGFVSLGVHCSEECISTRMSQRADEIQKDIIVVFVARD